MIPIRYSSETKSNQLLKETPAKAGETNRQWLARIGATTGIIFLGGSSLAHFRIRVAQSQLRQDLLPSFWSLCGILSGKSSFLSVPLDLGMDVSEIPQNNGVQTCQLGDYDDPKRFPNIAVINFTDTHAPILASAGRVRGQRSTIDLPSLVLPWLGFVWGAGSSANPLLEGKGLPSAAFVETAYGIAGVELTPGLSSASSCPEAIWQSAKWWGRYYEETKRPGDEKHAGTAVPQGQYAIRQPDAAVVEEKTVPKQPRVRKRR